MTTEVEFDQEKIETILRGITIPSPPQVVADLQMEMLGADPDLITIAEIISTDPGLAGGVLKAANSPVFNTGKPLKSVREAVIRLGLQTVDKVVNTLCIRSELDGRGMNDQVAEFMTRFWDSCADIATISTMVAERAGVKEYRDDAFLLGLFHNAGIALLTMRFDNYMDIMVESYGEHDQRIVDIENYHLDTNHAVIGYYIAKSWKLPLHVGEAIAKHHSLKAVLASNSEDEKIKTLLAILKVAEHISGFYRSIANRARNFEWEELSDDLMTYLNLTQDDFEDLVTHVLEQGLGSAGEAYY